MLFQKLLYEFQDLLSLIYNNSPYRHPILVNHCVKYARIPVFSDPFSPVLYDFVLI